MINDYEQAYILTTQEMALLLSKRGSEGVYMADKCDFDISRNSLLLSLQRLITRNLLMNEGHCLRMEDGLRECIECVAKADRILTITAQNSMRAPCIYVHQTKVTVTEPLNDPSWLRLQTYSIEQLCSLLTEWGMTPHEQRIGIMIEQEPNKQHKVMSMKCNYFKTGVESYLEIIDDGINYLLRRWSEDCCSEDELFTLEALKKAMKEYLEV